MDDLRWIRVFTPMHIPPYLVEQVKQRDYSVEDFFTYQENICAKNTTDGLTLNPFSHLYVLANAQNLTKGFLWFSVDPLTKDIVIQTYSIDKEYWKDGGAVEKICKFIKEIRSKGNLNKIYWVTAYPKHSIKHGFKASKSILMEYSKEEGEKDGKNNDGERKSWTD